MPDEGGAAEAVTGLVATITAHPRADLPQAAGEEWLAVLRQWLAREGLGLVSIANPESFSWPGHWIGIVERPQGEVAVLLFGTPSAVIASADAPELLGRGVEELRFRQALLLAPFDLLTKPAADAGRAAGELIGIYITEGKTRPLRSVEAATALPNRGLAGDRYAEKAGTFTPDSPSLGGYDITLIESEVLEHLTLPDGTRLAPEESRRNLLTRGVDLNALVGREFRIGPVRAFGQRLCEPCVHLERLTRPGVVAGLAHRGGLRADLLSGGEIRVGDTVTAAD